MNPLVPNDGPMFRPLDLLTARDLTDWKEVPLFAAARHFHHLHRHFGVAEGLIVSLAGTTVTVSTGVAYDTHGRTLQLTEQKRPELEMSGPELKNFWIVLRAAPPEKRQLNVIVPTPTPCWVEILPGTRDAPPRLEPQDVPLARICRKDEGGPLTRELDNRSVAVRAFRRPYIATGVVPSGTTSVPLPEGRGWEVWIDTRLAGFLPSHDANKPHGHSPSADTPAADPNAGPLTGEPVLDAPVYVVTIGGQNTDDANRFRTGKDVPDLVENNAPFVTVSQACHHGFLLRVEYDKPIDDLNERLATPLEVHWTGIEQRAKADRQIKNEPGQSEGFSMSQTIGRRQLPWPKFRDIQSLSAQDLNDVQETVRELQSLHNRTLHDWGVAEGCAVLPLPDRRGVLVQPGYVLDVEGRELIVSDQIQLDVPAQKVASGPQTRKSWWVTASYRTTTDTRDEDASCRQQGVPLRRLPQAVIRWRDPEESEAGSRLEPGYDVIVGTADLDQGEVVAVSMVGRRSAVPPKRPYIFGGRETIEPPKPESDCDEPTPGRQAPKNVTPDEPTWKCEGDWCRVTINTVNAGFVRIPQYLYTLEFKLGHAPYTAAAQPFIENVSSTQFDLVVPRVVVGTKPKEKKPYWGQWAIILVLLLLLLLGILLFHLMQNEEMWTQIASNLAALAVVGQMYWTWRKKPNAAPAPPPAPASETKLAGASVLEFVRRLLDAITPPKKPDPNSNQPGLGGKSLLVIGAGAVVAALPHLLLTEFLKVTAWAKVAAGITGGMAVVSSLFPTILTVIDQFRAHRPSAATAGPNPKSNPQPEEQGEPKPGEPAKPEPESAEESKVTVAWVGIEV
ncbi:hypothetical protein [Zavarzinella formosa]|uniref:hypothetical protein n=1 Tax=Zavarzinella formosa TaxID=360055 RepID=UPI0003159376|nr:hypothetical protein [Zavarzinella formosa]